MAFGRLRGDNDSPNAEINMIPLIDVMLVLLVIFIITAPMVTQSVKLKLPETTSIESPPEQVVDKPTLIAVNGAQEIHINEVLVALEALPEALSSLKASLGGSQPIIQLHIDASVPYELVAKLLTALSAVGLANIGFVSLPEDKK